MSTARVKVICADNSGAKKFYVFAFMVVQESVMLELEIKIVVSVKSAIPSR